MGERERGGKKKREGEREGAYEVASWGNLESFFKGFQESRYRYTSLYVYIHVERRVQELARRFTSGIGVSQTGTVLRDPTYTIYIRVMRGFWAPNQRVSRGRILGGFCTFPIWGDPNIHPNIL